MKKVIKAAQNDRSANLFVQYLNADDIQINEVGIRTMTVKRLTLTEALTVMLEHINLDSLDLDYDEMNNYTVDEIIEAIDYANTSMDSDYILYLENRATGEVYIDNNYPEENY